VGVIGAGYLGRHHARIYSELEEAELSAVVDLDPARAAEVASQCGARPFSDYREILGKVDAVSVVTPTETHHDIALECLRAGCDVLVEKPVTATVAEADALIEEADKRCAVLQVGHLERYNPAVVSASRLVDRPVLFECERLSPFLERAAGVDVTLDLMIHDIDVITSLLEGSGTGSVIRELRAAGASVLTDRVDVARAWIEFDGGVTADLAANRVSRERLRLLRIYQRDCHIVVDYQGRKVERFFRTPGGLACEPVPVEDSEPLREELSDFLACIGSRQCPAVSGVAGRNALDTALRITGLITRPALGAVRR
jgi:predicted dehydrogenase